MYTHTDARASSGCTMAAKSDRFAFKKPTKHKKGRANSSVRTMQYALASGAKAAKCDDYE